MTAMRKLIDGLVFTNLSSLAIDHNSLSDHGVCALAMCLGSTSNLRSLNLENCGCGDIGGSALARALVTNTSLQHLLLAQNEMGESTGLVFASVLMKHNSTLIELAGLDDNSPGVHRVSTCRMVREALERNKRVGYTVKSEKVQAPAQIVARAPISDLIAGEIDDQNSPRAGLTEEELATFKRIATVEISGAAEYEDDHDNHEMKQDSHESPSSSGSDSASAMSAADNEAQGDEGTSKDAINEACVAVNEAAEAFAAMHG